MTDSQKLDHIIQGLVVLVIGLIATILLFITVLNRLPAKVDKEAEKPAIADNTLVPKANSVVTKYEVKVAGFKEAFDNRQVWYKRNKTFVAINKEEFEALNKTERLYGMDYEIDVDEIRPGLSETFYYIEATKYLEYKEKFPTLLLLNFRFRATEAISGPGYATRTYD
jgi:hypothetical protein